MQQPSSNPFVVIREATLNWWYDWVNQILFNILWALCWVTVILGPPATLALVAASTELVEGKTVSPRELYDFGKQYFVPSWIWMAVNLAVGFGFVSNYLFYQQISQPWAPWAEAIIIVLAVYWSIVQFYTLPFLIMQDEPSLKLAWRNGLLTVSKTPFFTLPIILYAVIIMVISVASGFLIFLLGGVPLITILASQAARRRVQIETYTP
ncbi:MAG: hypothetical protein AAF614_36255 [Chloroflexota bacterium]